MSDEPNQEARQGRDARLLNALKTPPLSRDELRAELKRAREAKKAGKPA